MTRATTYTAPVKGVPGLLADDNPVFTISRAVETAAGIGFGLVCSRGTDKDKQIVLGGATPLGIVCRSQYYDNGAESVAQYEEAKIIRCGFVYLNIATTANAGSALCYRTATGVVDSGAPGGGEVAFAGELMEGVTGGDNALCWVDFTAGLDVETRLAACELAVGTTLPAVDAALQALFTGMGVAVGISSIMVKFNDLDMKTDESEKTAALPGTAASFFIPMHYAFRCVTASGTPDGDGTINIGTSTGGTEILSAGACTGITALNKVRSVPVTAGAFSGIAGNATLYCNVESPDGDAGTVVYDVYLFGLQVGA